MEIVRYTGEVTEQEVTSIASLIAQLGPKYPPEFTKEYVQGRLDRPKSSLFCAYDDGNLRGILFMGTVEALSGDKTWIEDVVVDEPFRGNGIGRLLVDASITYAKDSCVTHINLNTGDEREAANHLYVAAGFEPVDTNTYRIVLR